MDFTEQLGDLTIQITALLRTAASGEGLTVAQVQLLLCMPFDKITMSELAMKLGVDPSTMTRNAKKLCDKNYLEQSRDILDARKRMVVLTKTGEQTVGRLEERLDEFTSHIIENLDQKTLDALSNSLEELTWAINKFRTA